MLIKKKLLLILLIVGSGMFVYSQKGAGHLIIDQTGNVHPWSHLEINNDPSNFQFAIVTDRTGGHREGVFESAVHKLNLLQPEFVMSVGDLIEGYTRDRKEIYREWDEFNGFIKKLQMPFFYVPGNHDYINDVMAEIWEEKYGKSYYHFVYNDVLFLCLNSEEATKGSNMGGIEKAQYKYVKKVLKEHENVRWALVFMHQPLWILDNTRYWPEVEQLLKDRRHTVFVGHHHHYVKYTRNNGKYFMLATTGGSSRLRGTGFGEFDHVVWVTMTDEGPVIANLLLEGIWDEDVVNEHLGEMIKLRPISFKPLEVSGDRFKEGVQQIKLTNDENIPMDYLLKFKTQGDLNIPEEISGTVPPNNVELLDLELTSDRELGRIGMDAVDINAKFTFLMNEERNVDLVQKYRFSPVLFYPVKTLRRDVDFDGIIDEWGDFSFVSGDNPLITGDLNSFEGSGDVNLFFDTKYDDEYLYISIKVQDDDILLDRKKSVWRQDGIRVYLDSRNIDESYANREENPGKDYMSLFLSPSPSDDYPDIIYRTEYIPEGVEYKSYVNQEASSHSYEIRVPIAWLNRNQGNIWQGFRLNIGVNDADHDGSQKTIWWKPEWRSEKNIGGSGLFKKE